MESLLNVALGAVRAASRKLAHGVDRTDRLRILNDSEEDFATSMDLDSERTLVYQIRKYYPDHRIESRLSGSIGGADEQTAWLLEPLAGSRNYLAGLPWFGVAVVCRVQGIERHAALAFPQVNEEFAASRGQGAQLNSRRIRTGAETRPEGKLIGLYAPSSRRQALCEWQERLLARKAVVRQSGSAVFDISQTAANRLQGGWCGASAGFGVLAAELVLKEAGGLLAGESGQADIGAARELVFGNPRMVRELLRSRSTPRTDSSTNSRSKSAANSKPATSRKQLAAEKSAHLGK